MIGVAQREVGTPVWCPSNFYCCQGRPLHFLTLVTSGVYACQLVPWTTTNLERILEIATNPRVQEEAKDPSLVFS